MVRNYNQQKWEIVELRSGSNSKKGIQRETNVHLLQAFWLGNNVSRLFAYDWKLCISHNKYHYPTLSLVVWG